MALFSKKSLRRFWLNFHGILGLFVGSLFVILGLTGSILVVAAPLERAANTAIHIDEAAYANESYAEPEAMLANAREKMQPNEGLWRLVWPFNGTQTFQVTTFERVKGKGQDIWAYHMHPYTGEILDRKLGHSGTGNTSDWPLSYWFYQVHDNLFVGDIGHRIVGFTGIALLASALSGIILWWPKGSWKRALQLPFRGSEARRAYDTHRLVGICAAAFLCLSGATGSYFVFYKQYDPVIFSLFGGSRDQPHVELKRVEDAAEPMRLAQLYSAAQSRFPEAKVWCADFPAGGLDSGQPLKFYLRQPGEPTLNSGNTIVWVDPYRGEVVETFDARQVALGNRLIYWLFPLHTGEAFGWVGKIVIFLVGLTPLILFVSGWKLWRARRQGRKRLRLSRAALDR